MITKREMDLIEYYVYLVSKSFAFPFDWKEGHLSQTKSKVKITLVTTNFLFSCAYCVYILLRLFQRFGGYTMESMPFHVFAITCNCLFAIFNIHNFIYTAEMAALFNKLKCFNIKQGKTVANLLH